MSALGADPSPDSGQSDDDKSDVILHHGERVLSEALDVLRHLTPEGWDKFRVTAMRAGWHTTDLGIIADARLLSMRAGGRFGVSAVTGRPR